MASIFFKIYYVFNRFFLFLMFNLNHKIYRKYNNRFLRKIGVNINGEPRYISFNVIFDSTENYSLITLNDNCVITGSTLILTHDFSIWHASVGVKIISNTDPEFKRTGKVIVGENSFIGANSILLPGVEIGRNAIVGAGSVVTKNVPDNVIVAGNPARIISTIKKYVNKYS